MIDPDSAELDAIKELKHSPGYALVVERITEELERNRIELEFRATPELTEFIRGYIKALRIVLMIFEILENELKELK